MQKQNPFFSLKFALIIMVAFLAAGSLAYSAGKTTGSTRKTSPPRSAPAAVTKAPATPASAGGSMDAFRGFMSDSFLNKAYQAAQGSFLRTSPDQRMAAFFDTNPLFQSPDVQEKMDAVMKQGVMDSINTGLATMKRVTALTNPTLFNRFVTVAKRLGYSDKQIADAMFFRAEGEINAYTTSSFQDQIVVVVFDSLDNIMDERQEESVLGHELGHVLSRHVLRGAEHVAMTLQLGNLFAKNGDFGGFSDLNKLRHYEFYRHELEPYQQVFWDHVFNQFDLDYGDGSSAQKNPGSYQAFSEIKNIHRERFIDALQVLHDAARSQPDLGAKALTDYLVAMIQSLSDMDVPQDTIDYYKGLLQNLPNAANDQKDGQQFTEYMMQGIANAGGKALESTADRYGQVATDAWRAATTDLVFKGANLDPKTSGRADLSRDQLLDANIRETVDEWVLLHQINTPENLLEVLGRDPRQNHPLPIKRIIDMLVASRSIGTLGLSNPFLKNVILYDQLVKQSVMLQKELDEINTTLQSPEGKKMSVEQTRVVAKQVKEMQAFQQKSETDSAAVAGTILALIKDPAMDVNNPKASGRNSYQNPRLMDLLDFELASKQEEAEEYNEVLKDATTPDDRKEIKEVFDMKAQLRATPLLDDVRAYLGKGAAPKNLGDDVTASALLALKLLDKPGVKADDIEKVRATLATETGTMGRKSRIPVDLTARLQGTGPVGADTQGATDDPSSKQSKPSAPTKDNGKKGPTPKPGPHGDDLASHFLQCDLVLRGF